MQTNANVVVTRSPSNQDPLVFVSCHVVCEQMAYRLLSVADSLTESLRYGRPAAIVNVTEHMMYLRPRRDLITINQRVSCTCGTAVRHVRLTNDTEHMQHQRRAWYFAGYVTCMRVAVAQHLRPLHASVRSVRARTESRV